MLDILKKNEIDIQKFETILDFGCGVGRVLRHLRHFDEIEVHGTDYNSELISWCKENLKFADFQTNPIFGPLAYEDEKFDFIYALSVFTHLQETQQSLWMKELTRVLKPSGFLLITVHGESCLHTMQPQDHERFKRGELVVYGGQEEGSNLCTAHHPASYVREKMARNLIFIDHVPMGALGNPHQDVFIFKKPRLELL